MIRPLLTPALCALALMMAPPSIAAQSAPEVFQRALRAERVEGDLEAAVRLYGQVVEMGDRALSARALLRLGESLERIGGPGAEEAYRRLIAEFGDQAEAAEAARERLAALTLESSDAGRSAEGLITRRIWGEPMNWALNGGAVSPDGREIGAVYWEVNRPGNTGDLIVVDIETGALRVVGHTGAGSRELGSGADTYVTGYSWSRDGARLAYSEWTFGNDPNFQELHVVSSDGSGHRIVSSNPLYSGLLPHAWSSDGRWLVALLTGWDGVARIGTISTEDGSITILKTLRTGFNPIQKQRMTLALSPDDGYVAYAYAPSPQDAPDVHVLAVDGSTEEVIAASGATEVNPLWTPDGSRLVFLSDRSGVADFWAVEMSEGRAAGDPYIVYSHVGPAVPLGFTDDGALTYRMEVPVGQLGIVDIDDEGVHFDMATPLTDRFVGSNSEPAFSPDGTRVAYLSVRAEGGLQRNRYLVVQSLLDGTERDIPLGDMGWFLTIHRTRPQWSADGRSILLQGAVRERTETGLMFRYTGYRVDVETGEVQREPHMWSSQSFALDVTGRQSDRLRELGIRIDGFRFVTEAIRDGYDTLRPGERLLWMREQFGWLRGFECDREATYEAAACIGPGLLEPIAGDPEASDLHRWHLSPDGGQIAYILRDEENPSVFDLWVRSVTMDDEPTLLVAGLSCLCAPRWTPDGRHVLYMEAGGTVYRVPTEGGNPVRLEWELTPEQLATLSFDPQGNRAVMPVVERSQRVEIWALSGFPWESDGSN